MPMGSRRHRELVLTSVNHLQLSQAVRVLLFNKPETLPFLFIELW